MLRHGWHLVCDVPGCGAISPQCIDDRTALGWGRAHGWRIEDRPHMPHLVLCPMHAVD